MKKIILIALITQALFTFVCADCPYDHFGVGRNSDGVNGTADDNKLFVDVTHIYRHTDLERIGDPTWLNWHYPMFYDDYLEEYYVSEEPGFGSIENDPNRQLIGTKNVDYKITIKCVSITSGFIARNLTENITLDEAGDTINFSELDDHLHLDYIYPWLADTGEPDELLWITYQICDTLEDGDVYETSNEFTLVFLKEPTPGDIAVDRSVDLLDLEKLAGAWLLSSDDSLFNTSGQAAIDRFDRGDINRDYHVNFIDFCLLAQHWQQQP